MKISQARVSPAIRKAAKSFNGRHGLRDYAFGLSPAIFYGFYTADDMDAVAEHSGTSVVVWTCPDVDGVLEAAGMLGRMRLEKSTVFHVSTSSNIQHQLRAAGLQNILLPFLSVQQQSDGVAAEGDWLDTDYHEHARRSHAEDCSGNPVVQPVHVYGLV